MKIFNWVHRRFNNKAENGRKNGLIGGDDERQFTVENNTSAFECWRGGILSIGTFGYDPLKDENELCFDEEEPDKEQLSEEYESDDVISTDSDDDEEEEEEVENEQGEEEVKWLVDGHDLERLLMEGKKRVAVDDEFEFEYVMLEKTTKKARTTLADLFSADIHEELQETKQKQPINKGSEQPALTKEKANGKLQQGFSFGKKLMVDDTRPIHKLHQLMRRMLKRKVHPDDYASLLPSQGQGEDAINDA